MKPSTSGGETPLFSLSLSHTHTHTLTHTHVTSADEAEYLRQALKFRQMKSPLEASSQVQADEVLEASSQIQADEVAS